MEIQIADIAKMENTIDYLNQVIEKLEKIVALQNLINSNKSDYQAVNPYHPVYLVNPWYPTYPTSPIYQPWLSNPTITTSGAASTNIPYEPEMKVGDVWLGNTSHGKTTWRKCGSKQEKENNMQSINNVMNNDAPKGTKVKFAFPKNGYKSDQEFANQHLEEDMIYTVDFTSVGGWHTDVYLEEFPGKPFNSVLFEEA